jgi:hypothetical protein
MNGDKYVVIDVLAVELTLRMSDDNGGGLYSFIHYNINI